MTQSIQIISPLEAFYKWEQQKPNVLYLRQPFKGEWQNYTWKRCGEEIRKMASALKAFNLPPQSKISILSKNCVHWILADYAIWMAGHVSVPLYPNITHHTLREILEHSEAKAIFLGKLDDWNDLKPGVPDHLIKIAFPFYGITEFNNWDDLCKNNQPLSENFLPDIHQLATIMYTSGTTGQPKGVMHSFFNFAFAASYALPTISVGSEARFFSYLPMCHIAERLLIEMGCLYCGGNTSFSENLETFPKNLAETQPTVFLAVPRIWAKFQEKIMEKLPQKKLTLLLKIPVLNSIIKTKIKKGLGLTKATNIFSGAAPISPELVLWFKSIGIAIQEAYAMTENSCYSHVNRRDKNKIGTVGQAFPGVDVLISEDGEILIKHAALMLGYYKQPTITADSFSEQGFFKTGDKGAVDAKGYLKITGRVKDLFKTSKGKYVSPSPIELKLEMNTDIEQVCVVGMGMPQPIALIVLSQFGKAKSKEDIEKSIKATLNTINTELDSFEKMENAVIVKDEWTVENGLLTPTLKMKRNEVEKKYSAMYQVWYDDQRKVLWA